MMQKTIITSALIWVSALSYAAPPMATVDYVDLERFMGDWFVIANIPTCWNIGNHKPVTHKTLKVNIVDRCHGRRCITKGTDPD